MSRIIVIGGGIAGTSVGARLSHLGTVTLLERESALAYHASGRSAAMFEQKYGLPTTRALNEASADYHRTANGGVLSPRGLMLAAGADEAEAFASDLADMDMIQISAEEGRALFPLLDPDKTPLVAHHQDAWDIDTDRLIQNFASEIKRNGGRVLTNAEVTSIKRTDAGWVVTTGDETHEAELLVNAAGAWVDQIAELAGITPIGIKPLRRSMARIPVPEGMNPQNWPMVFGAGESWYAKPDAGALIVSPADEDPQPPMDAWADDLVLAEGLSRFEERMMYEVTRIISNWAGLRSFAPDKQLVLGPDPGDPPFVWMAGQGGYGFQTAPAASELVADLVGGRTPVLSADVVAALSPARFTNRRNG